MKENVVIKSFDKILYSGNILEIPIKEPAIIEKSIALFGDEDPCVVHMSFVVKEFVNDLLNLFKANNYSTLKISDHLEILKFLNFDDFSNLTIEVVGKKQ